MAPTSSRLKVWLDLLQLARLLEWREGFQFLARIAQKHLNLYSWTRSVCFIWLSTIVIAQGIMAHSLVLDKKVELMVLSNQILTTLSQYVAVRVSGLGFAASSSVLEPNIHLSGLYSQFPCQIFFLVTIGPLKCLEGVFQKPHLWFCEPQLLARPFFVVIVQASVRTTVISSSHVVGASALNLGCWRISGRLDSAETPAAVCNLSSVEAQAVDRCEDVVVSVIPHWGCADTNTQPAARCWDAMKSVLMSRGSSFRYSSSWRLMELQRRDTPILILLSSCVLSPRAAAPWKKLCLNLLSALDLQWWSTSENGGRAAILSRINNTSIKLVWRPPRERIIFDSVFSRQSSCIFSALCWWVP